MKKSQKLPYASRKWYSTVGIGWKDYFIMHCDYSAMTMVGYAGRGPPMADEYRIPVPVY